MLLSWLKRHKWRKQLAGCNYTTAKSLLARKFSESIISTDFSNRLDRFIADPCFDTAADLLDIAPQLISYFETSKAGDEMNLLWK
jgi:hypothetical protein